ncbi:MAG: ABC-F family ATP-binding cassette domain-containing protein [Acidobacteria bacterium]|nr:ABC-F family ATP-binding cassette domain-containing protein [Acidobacteriota bacterium]MDA1235315.1 ABC-F family ATP-binding cassette domain-containing protein [Acidobacteriota bacterium]
MLQISDGAMRYADRTLFDGLNWLIQPQDKIGVVGANGTGKSTILKILLGMERLDQGEVNQQKGLRVGYLPQDGLSFSGRKLFEECLSVFDEAIALEQEQEELAHQMGELDPTSDEYEAVVDRYTWVMDRYNALDGYTKEVQVGTVLGGLSFLRSDWDKPTETFSGGWQMRIALAKLLLEKPNLLLLDEPTNHLDLEARNWLEDYLQSYPNAFLLISHDRFFLDQTVQQVVEIWNKQVHFYKGNYSKYEVQKTARREQLIASYKNQRTRIEQLEAFISRFRYQASKAPLVQSRVKELEKIERIEIPPAEKVVHFRFPQPPASGRVVIEGKGVSKYYGDNKVLENVSFHIEKGDRVALVGHNGAGKSTLIRLMSGLEPPTAGEIKVGYKVETDYFAQDQYKEMNPEAILFDEIADRARGMNDAEVRSLLGCFLFSGDDVFKRVGVLSGGERNRFALARMLLEPHNFLLLDEPTNHLDMRAKDVLLRAMMEFTGTIVFVSHDRYFIDRLATKVFAIGGGTVETYPGNYEEYQWALARRGEAQGTTTAPGAPSAELMAALDFHAKPAAPAPAPQNGAAADSKKKRLNPIKADKLRKRVAALEAEVAHLEKENSTLQGMLQNFASDFAKQAEALESMEKRRKKIEACEDEWGKLTAELEKA